jgi:hypothetical protein
VGRCQISFNSSNGDTVEIHSPPMLAMKPWPDFLVAFAAGPRGEKSQLTDWNLRMPNSWKSEWYKSDIRYHVEGAGIASVRPQ